MCVCVCASVFEHTYTHEIENTLKDRKVIETYLFRWLGACCCVHEYMNTCMPIDVFYCTRTHTHRHHRMKIKFLPCWSHVDTNRWVALLKWDCDRFVVPFQWNCGKRGASYTVCFVFVRSIVVRAAFQIHLFVYLFIWGRTLLLHCFNIIVLSLSSLPFIVSMFRSLLLSIFFCFVLIENMTRIDLHCRFLWLS